VGEVGQPEEDGGLLLLLLGFDLGDFVFGGGEAGGQSFDFAEPSFAFGEKLADRPSDLRKRRS
jgi:hypothetical protein